MSVLDINEYRYQLRRLYGVTPEDAGLLAEADSGDNSALELAEVFDPLTGVLALGGGAALRHLGGKWWEGVGNRARSKKYRQKLEWKKQKAAMRHQADVDIEKQRGGRQVELQRARKKSDRLIKKWERKQAIKDAAREQRWAAKDQKKRSETPALTTTQQPAQPKAQTAQQPAQSKAQTAQQLAQPKAQTTQQPTQPKAQTAQQPAQGSIPQQRQVDLSSIRRARQQKAQPKAQSAQQPAQPKAQTATFELIQKRMREKFGTGPLSGPEAKPISQTNVDQLIQDPGKARVRNTSQGSSASNLRPQVGLASLSREGTQTKVARLYQNAIDKHKKPQAQRVVTLDDRKAPVRVPTAAALVAPTKETTRTRMEKLYRGAIAANKKPVSAPSPRSDNREIPSLKDTGGNKLGVRVKQPLRVPKKLVAVRSRLNLAPKPELKKPEPQKSVASVRSKPQRIKAGRRQATAPVSPPPAPPKSKPSKVKSVKKSPQKSKTKS